MKIVNKKSVSILSFVLALTLIISGTLTSMQPAHMATSPFSDVPSTHWGIDGILAAYEDGVMTGTYHNPNTGERQFSPAAPLTMAEWSVMILSGLVRRRTLCRSRGELVEQTGRGPEPPWHLQRHRHPVQHPVQRPRFPDSDGRDHC